MARIDARGMDQSGNTKKNRHVLYFWSHKVDISIFLRERFHFLSENIYFVFGRLKKIRIDKKLFFNCSERVLDCLASSTVLINVYERGVRFVRTCNKVQGKCQRNFLTMSWSVNYFYLKLVKKYVMYFYWMVGEILTFVYRCFLWARDVISSILNKRTMRGKIEEVIAKECVVCGRTNNSNSRRILKKCGGCEKVWYCSRKHQKMDWMNGHAKVCACL